MAYHNESTEEILRALGADPDTGLTGETAATRLAEHGENRLREKKKKSTLRRFLDQFKDVMILILLAAAAVSFVIACTGDDPMEFFEPGLILLIVILNAVMGMLQESKAEKALDALKSMSAPHARVLRDGREQVIDASLLVPGDILKLEAGDFVPADARLLRSTSLKSEESALTGESVPAEKDADATVDEKAPLGDRVNMVYSGCSITYGTATAVVTATGMQTEMGRIAGLLEGEDEGQTPLQKKLAQLGKYLGIVALVACAVIFVVGLLYGHRHAGNLHDGGLAGRLRHPGGTARHRDDRALHRRAADGEEKRAHPPPARGGDAGQRLRHLLGQNRHPHAEPHDARPSVHGRRGRGGAGHRRLLRRRAADLLRLCRALLRRHGRLSWDDEEAAYRRPDRNRHRARRPAKTACPRTSSIATVRAWPSCPSIPTAS